jgi:hydroxymethylglutaryl-CoA reductase
MEILPGLNESSFTGFSKLNRDERLQRLVVMGALTPADLAHLKSSHSHAMLTLSENLVENVIGCFPLPLGIAAHFHIDGRDIPIPMAVEETSVIASASATAKWIREQGEITTEIQGDSIIGQIQLPIVKDFTSFVAILMAHKQLLIDEANHHVVPGLVARHGGITDLTVRCIVRPDGATMAVIHVLLNPCDAMGANLVNQVCEFLKEPIQMLTGERVALCILSNLADTKITHAKVVIRNIDPIIGQGIVEASLFARCDPYRAATHNKGVLNGIDPIVIATGNDWRAVEAGIHAYACRSGQYQPITVWYMVGQDLIGQFAAPIMVGTVGGVTRLHPTAQMCLRMMQIQSADQLARVIAAVGLVQNLGAIKALSTKGIVKGHMKLHINNLLLSAGATLKEQIELQIELQGLLQTQHKITLSDVEGCLQRLRQEQHAA